MSYRRYLLTVLILALLGFAPFGLSMLVVRQTGENLTYDRTVELQLARGAVFGPMFNADHHLYKRALYRAVLPEVVTVGSSTMVPFRADYFSAPFLNCCRVSDDLPQLEAFLDWMVAAHPPKVVIIGLDFWWFRYAEAPAKRYTPAPALGDEWTWAKLTRPWGMLGRGDLGGRELGLPGDRIGFMGLLRDRGFRPDGSFDYGPVHDAMDPDPAQRVRHVRALLDTGNARFARSKRTWDSNFEIVARMLAKVRAAGCHAVLIFPPVVEELLDELARRPEEYGYVPQVVEGLRRFGIPFVDYRDARPLGSGADEFYDEIHGGDVTMARLLLDLGGRDPEVGAVLDRARLTDVVARYAGVPRLPD